MLNIGRMGRGSSNYYLDAVARTQVDYYHGHGEAPGRWMGSGLDGLELEAGLQVTREALGRVLDGDHPTTGERVASHPARQVPGFDLTFRAPSPCRCCGASGDEQVAGQVQAAHDAAVTATLGYLEQHVARSRRGAGGVEQVAVDGLVAAAFTHRTSRDGDPLLHTHLLVANLARTSDDGVWRTVDSRRLFTHAKTAGTLYQAHLRDELTRRLGVQWGPVVNGCADLKGVERELDRGVLQTPRRDRRPHGRPRGDLGGGRAGRHAGHPPGQAGPAGRSGPARAVGDGGPWARDPRPLVGLGGRSPARAAPGPGEGCWSTTTC